MAAGKFSAPDDRDILDAQSTFTAEKHTVSPFVFVGSKFVGRERRGSNTYGNYEHCRIAMAGVSL